MDVGDDLTYDAVRDAIADLELGLIRMEQRQAHIEDVFRAPRPREREVEHVIAS